MPPDGKSPSAETDIRDLVRRARLRYVSDEEPGIVRHPLAQKGFRFSSAGSKTTLDVSSHRRASHLAIPPAWTDVWICAHANGHIQATGRDARGRKQYLYHASWREVRDETKYDRLLAFGRVLPRIRRRVGRDLRRSGIPHEKVLAAMVRLLDLTHIRIGNEKYARENHSFGLSTMRRKHVRIKGTRLHFDFRGKSGKQHEIDLHDRRLAGIVRAIQDIPGQTLFQYVTTDGGHRPVSSHEINAYLRAIAGAEFSAKDFRTWAGTTLAAAALAQKPLSTSLADSKRQQKKAIEEVALQLGNTPAICRKSYIHPAILAAHHRGERITLTGTSTQIVLGGLSVAEKATIQLLKKH